MKEIMIGWLVGSTKSSQRKYAASKLISRLTGSARLLAMSWSQREFEGEKSVALVLQRLSDLHWCVDPYPMLLRSCLNTFDSSVGLKNILELFWSERLWVLKSSVKHFCT